MMNRSLQEATIVVAVMFIGLTEIQPQGVIRFKNQERIEWIKGGT